MTAGIGLGGVMSLMQIVAQSRPARRGSALPRPPLRWPERVPSPRFDGDCAVSVTPVE